MDAPQLGRGEAMEGPLDIRKDVARTRDYVAEMEATAAQYCVHAIDHELARMRPRVARLEEIAAELLTLPGRDDRTRVLIEETIKLFTEAAALKAEGTIAMDEQCFREHGVHILTDPKVRRRTLRAAALA